MTTTHFLEYDHVFVILRVDPTADRASAPEAEIGLLKALWSQAEAEAEVARLNQPHRGQNAVYFWKAVRLARRSGQAGRP